MHSRSDLDVLVVTRTSLGQHQRARLTALLLDLSGRHPRRMGGQRPVELTVVSQPDVCPWRYPARIDFLYGEWWRAEFDNGRLPEPHVSPDLALVLAQVLACDSPLLGTSASEVLQPVPTLDVVAATRAGVSQLLADLDSDTTNVLLTLARAWHTVATGQIVSKDEAAAWALPRLSAADQAVLSHARSVYLDLLPEDWQQLEMDVEPTADRLASRVGAAHT